MTSRVADGIFAACEREIAFNFLYQFRTTPSIINQKKEAMKISALQKYPPQHLIAFFFYFEGVHLPRCEVRRVKADARQTIQTNQLFEKQVFMAFGLRKIWHFAQLALTLASPKLGCVET